MRIETLTTCHNRREQTLQALANLHAQKLPAGVSMAHTIVDDGSTDGTTEAVEQAFPDVEIIPGDGGLYWAGGMRHGWEKSVRHKPFDYLLVYNDDVCLQEDAVARLLEVSLGYLNNSGTSAHAVAGAFVDTDGNTSYGGVVRSSRWHPLRFGHVEPLDERYTLVDTMNMNTVLISREALDLIGFLSVNYKHSAADYDYGLRLNKAGGAVLLAPGYVGECDRNSVIGSPFEPGISFAKKLRRLHGDKHQPFRQRLHHYKQHAGPMWIILLLWMYFKLPITHIKSKLRR